MCYLVWQVRNQHQRLYRRHDLVRVVKQASELLVDGFQIQALCECGEHQQSVKTHLPIGPYTLRVKGKCNHCQI